MNPHPFIPLPNSIGPICAECRKRESDPIHVTSAKIDLPPGEIEFTPAGQLNPLVEQALDVAHMLPPEDPARLELLRQCARHLSGALNYVGFIVEPEKEEAK